VGGGRLQTSGTWEEVFGRAPPRWKICIGLNFARLRRPGGRGGQSRIPDPDVREQPRVRIRKGQRATGPCGGAPMPDLIDIWQAGRRKSTLLSPDIYDPDYPLSARDTPAPGTRWFIPGDAGIPAEQPGGPGSLRLRTP